MAKSLKYFPLWVDNWLAGTMSLGENTQEKYLLKGLYIDLLCHLYSGVPCIKNTDHIARLTGLDPRTCRRLWPKIEPKFVRNQHGYQHEVVSKILHSRKDINDLIDGGFGNKDKDKDKVLVVSKDTTCGNSQVSTLEDSNKKPPQKANGAPYQKILDLWGQELPELPQPIKLTNARKAQIRARWSDELPDLEAWQECFGHIRKSKFLMGKVDPPPNRKRFVCTLDWITKQGNLVKLYEGKYDD